MSELRYSRQSFLGEEAQLIFGRTVMGIVGLGGGGSHVAQQLAHLGFLHYVLYDPDRIKEHNLNRTVGATESDFRSERLKTHVARRTIKGVQSTATVECYASRWQDNPGPLRSCDIIFGCVDGFKEREELERSARRYLIPYVDVGMDVFCVGNEPPRMGGQIMLSVPGGPCMACLGFLNEGNLKRDGERYGDAGPNPQVVWSNGILASTAVGIAVDLLTGWTRSEKEVVYLSFDGNASTLTPHIRLQYFGTRQCTHYPIEVCGDPVFRKL